MSAEPQVDRTTPGADGSAAAAAPRRIGVAGQLAISAKVGAHHSLGELVLTRCGRSHPEAVKVLSYIAAYGVFVEQNGREPRSIVELGQASSRRSRATLNRWATAFQAAFPEYASPAVLWTMVRDQVEVEDETVLSLSIGAVTL